MHPALRSLGIASFFAIITGAGGKLSAQGVPELTGAVAASTTIDGTPEPLKMDLKAGWQTQKEARALTMSIPAPRGQIVDRNGIPLAQNRVAQYLALNFPFFGNEVTDAQILEYAQKRIVQANKALGKSWSLPSDRLISHYKNRRWLPLVFSINDGLNEEITPEQQVRIKPLLTPGNGLMLQPAYLRFYPKGACAPHIIGYTGKTRPLPVAPIQDGDPLFEEVEGREGLEKSFDSDLHGKPGVINVLFNPDGTKMDEQILRRPIPGNNVVTTLDYNFQKYAENALAKNSISSAMVIMDVKTGDILAMASYPFYDLNLFVPGVSTATFKMLNEDKRLPLFARAFRGEYPPASTFKVIVSLAALESGKINAKTSYNCSSSLAIGDRVFHNWNKEGEGDMNVIGAIKRSCNTWFYQAAMELGANPITDMAQRLGIGEATGIPLAAEGRGFVPTNAWMMQKLGHKMQGGDIANLSIGQGRTLVTPLQAVQAMAALADGVNMPQARLVKQIQDSNDRVLQAFEPMVRRRVDLQPEAHETVVKGMVAVVNGEGGTGRAASLKECQVAGKTGTAQWKPTEDRNLAWFTGFLPANEPVYAYALVYEGQPNETVSGGKVAAPIVHEVFENVFKNAPPDDPILLMAKDESNKAIAVTDEDEKTEGSSSNLNLGTEPAPAAPPQPEKKEKGIGGFFKKLFGR